MSWAIDKLCELLDASGLKVTLDMGRSIYHNCFFCNKAAAPTHNLMDVGVYYNGNTITRPVCEECRPIALKNQEDKK